MVHVCMVGRWRVNGEWWDALAPSIIKPYPHASTLNSYHSNQSHPIVKLVTVNIVGSYSDRSQIMCTAT